MSVTKQVSLHGKRAFITPDDQLAAKNGFVAGGDGKPAIVLPGSPDTTAIFEDYQRNDTGPHLISVLTTDTGNANSLQAGTNGVFRLFSTMHPGTPNAPTSTGKLSGLVGPSLNWKANQGPGAQSGRLRFGTRLKINTVARAEALGTNRIHVFAGFTDLTTIEMPAYDTGAGVISAASDLVGFLFSPGGDTGWSAVAAKSTAGDSGDLIDHLSAAVTGNTYQTLEVEVHRGASDTGSTATFYIDGKAVGSISSPVASAVALTPAIYAFGQDTGTNFVDVDWVNVSAPRDTGL